MSHSHGQAPSFVTGGGRDGGRASEGLAALASCPVCVQIISDPYVTTCGHTFCYQCIARQLTHKKVCPSCDAYLTTEHIYPNFLLNAVRDGDEQGSALARASRASSPVVRATCHLRITRVPPPSCYPQILQNAAAAPTAGTGNTLLSAVQRLLTDSLTPGFAVEPPPGLPHAAGLARSTLQPSRSCGPDSPAASGAHAGLRTAAVADGAAARKAGEVGRPRARLRLRDVDLALEALYEAREELERRESSDELHLLLSFLLHAE
jgi:hypothetical protein